MKIDRTNKGSFIEFLGRTSRNILMGLDFKDRLFKVRSENNRRSSKDLITIDERNTVNFHDDVYIEGKLVLSKAIIERINSYIIKNIYSYATFTFGETEHDDVNNGTIQLIAATDDGTTHSDGTHTVTYKIKNDNSADPTAASPEFNTGSDAEETAKNFTDLVNSSNGHGGNIIASYIEGKVFLQQSLPGEDGNTTITTASSFDNACSLNAPSAFIMRDEIVDDDFKNFTTLLLNIDGNLDIILPDTSNVGVTKIVPRSVYSSAKYDISYGRKLYIKRVDKNASFNCNIISGNAKVEEKTTISFQASVGGSVVAGGTNWIQLDGSASSTDDLYNDLFVEITAGDSIRDIRKIIDYQGADKIAIVEEDFTQIPDRITASTYRVHAAIKDSANQLDAFSVGEFIKVFGASNSGNNNVFQIATRADGGGTLGLAKGINLTAESASAAISIYTGLINNEEKLNILSGDYIDLICDGTRWYTKNSSLIDRQLQLNGQLIIDEIPSTDVRSNVAGKGLVYVQNDAPNTLKFKDDGGTTYDLGSNWFGSNTTIKILPRDFMGNDHANASIAFDDTTAVGVRAADADLELYAFVNIPLGYKATAVTISGSHAKGVTVYEANVNANTDVTSNLGTGNVNTEVNITDTAATATNYLIIRVNTTTTSNIVYGGIVDIERV